MMQNTTANALALASTGNQLFPTAAGLSAKAEMQENTMMQMNLVIEEMMQKLALAHTRLQEQNARISVLEQLVYVDDLTGLLNKRAFDDVLTREFDRCKRGHSQGGLLVMIDLDNFKSINDTYGHGAGDACLRTVGEALQANIRAMDAAARMGGDEFALLLNNADKADALNRIQNLAWKLNHLSFLWEETTIAIRASVGVREFDGHEDPATVLHDADASLYACKSYQKNKRREFTHAA